MLSFMDVDCTSIPHRASPTASCTCAGVGTLFDKRRPRNTKNPTWSLYTASSWRDSGSDASGKAFPKNLLLKTRHSHPAHIRYTLGRHPTHGVPAHPRQTPAHPAGRPLDALLLTHPAQTRRTSDTPGTHQAHPAHPDQHTPAHTQHTRTLPTHTRHTAHPRAPAARPMLSQHTSGTLPAHPRHTQHAWPAQPGTLAAHSSTHPAAHTRHTRGTHEPHPS